MNNIPIIVLDTETSGVDFLSSQVIQCGVIAINKEGKYIAETECNIKYKEELFSWDDRSAEIHKIPLEDIKKNGLEPMEFIEKLNSFIEKYYDPVDIGSIRIIAANAYFDYVMLKHFYDKFQQSENFPFSYYTIDLDTIGFILFGTESFAPLCKLLGVNRMGDKSHNALYDAHLHFTAFEKIKRIASNSVY